MFCGFKIYFCPRLGRGHVELEWDEGWDDVTTSRSRVGEKPDISGWDFRMGEVEGKRIFLLEMCHYTHVIFTRRTT